MGKSKLKIIRTEQTKLTVTGIVTDDNAVLYQDENGNDKKVNITDLVEPFFGKEVTLVITEKFDDDITI